MSKYMQLLVVLEEFGIWTELPTGGHGARCKVCNAFTSGGIYPITHVDDCPVEKLATLVRRWETVRDLQTSVAAHQGLVSILTRHDEPVTS